MIIAKDLRAWRLQIGILPIRVYQLALSPFVGFHCRYQPTCSAYGIEAIERHGLVKGLLLTLRRLGRCHPWGGSGYDPVPGAHGSAVHHHDCRPRNSAVDCSAARANH
jgi:putative membrane protein insertion efficiency factor